MVRKRRSPGKVASLAEAARGYYVFQQGKLCSCQVWRHRLVSNCLSFGKIVCEQEGEGPCSFCGALVLKTKGVKPNPTIKELPVFIPPDLTTKLYQIKEHDCALSQWLMFGDRPRGTTGKQHQVEKNMCLKNNKKNSIQILVSTIRPRQTHHR